MTANIYRLITALVLLLIDVQVLDNARESSPFAIACAVALLVLIVWIAWEVLELLTKLGPRGDS